MPSSSPTARVEIVIYKHVVGKNETFGVLELAEGDAPLDVLFWITPRTEPLFLDLG